MLFPSGSTAWTSQGQWWLGHSGVDFWMCNDHILAVSFVFHVLSSQY